MGSMTDIIVDDSIKMFTHGAGAFLLLDAMRAKLQEQPKKRIIAIGRCERGGAFTVTTWPQAPADFADAIAEVLTPDRVPTVRNMADCEDERIGEELSRQPWLW